MEVPLAELDLYKLMNQGSGYFRGEWREVRKKIVGHLHCAVKHWVLAAEGELWRVDGEVQGNGKKGSDAFKEFFEEFMDGSENSAWTEMGWDRFRRFLFLEDRNLREEREEEEPEAEKKTRGEGNVHEGSVSEGKLYESSTPKKKTVAEKKSTPPTRAPNLLQAPPILLRENDNNDSLKTPAKRRLESPKKIPAQYSPPKTRATVKATKFLPESPPSSSLLTKPRKRKKEES